MVYIRNQSVQPSLLSYLSYVSRNSYVANKLTKVSKHEKNVSAFMVLLKFPLKSITHGAKIIGKNT